MAMIPIAVCPVNIRAAFPKNTYHFIQHQYRPRLEFHLRVGRSVHARKEPMSKKKDPPGYPGDEAIRKRFGEVLHKLRLEKGLSIEEVDALVDKGIQEDTHPLLPRALSLVTRELREARKMSRAQLSEVSGLPLRLINEVERAKAHEITLTQIARIAMAMDHPVMDFVERVYKVEHRLRA